MSSFPILPLGEVIENFDGKRKPVTGKDRKTGPYPYYGASGIVDHVDDYIFDGEYLLIAEDGENLKTRNTPIAFRAKEKFWVNNHAHVVRANKHALTRYLEYAVNFSDISGYLSGSTMPKLTQGNLHKLPIVVPPLSKQREIVNILGSLDDKIELNRKMNETLEQMARALFKSWFVDFDPVHAKAAGKKPFGMDDATAALFPDSFEESELGLIPKGWRVVPLTEIMDFEGGTQPPASKFVNMPRDGYCRLIQIRDYYTDSHLTYVPDFCNLRKTSIFDTMIARYGASVGRICWGLEGAYNVALVKVVPKKPDLENFLWIFLSNSFFQERLLSMSSRSAQAGFNKSDFDVIRFPFPKQENLAIQYNKIAKFFREKIHQNNLENKEIVQTRDLILPQLLSGSSEAFQ